MTQIKYCLQKLLKCTNIAWIAASQFSTNSIQKCSKMFCKHVHIFYKYHSWYLKLN